MAPEMVKKGKKEYNEKVDVWAIGVTAFYLLSNGKYPFYGKNKAEVDQKLISADPEWDQLDEDVTQEAKDFLAKCLDKDKEQRPACEDLFSDPFFSQEFVGEPEVMQTVAFKKFKQGLYEKMSQSKL